MGAVSAEPGLSVAVHGEPDPGPPPEPDVVAFDRFDCDLPFDARDLPEQLCDARRLQPALGAQLHMLEVTTTATAGPGMPTGRFDPVGRGAEHLDGICPQIGARRGRDPGRTRSPGSEWRTKT